MVVTGSSTSPLSHRYGCTGNSASGNAIGKDYFPAGEFFAHTPSGTGYQASLGGLFGVSAGGDEGFELNVLGLVTGIDFVHPGLKLPGIGRIPG